MKKIKIVAPVCAVHEVAPLAENGADEFYCGVIETTGKFSLTKSLNARSIYPANLGNFEELGEVIKQAHSRGVKVTLALNGFYNEDQHKNAIIQAKKAADAGIDGFIITDLGLISELFKKYNNFNKKVHLSSRGPVFNNRALDFYKSLGIARVIVAPNLTLREIETLCGNGPEIEAFILNQRCPHTQVFCRTVHGFYSLKDKGMNKFANIVPHGSGVLWRKSRLINYSPLLGYNLHRFFCKVKERHLLCRGRFKCTFFNDQDVALKSLKGQKKIWDVDNYFNYSCAACTIYRFSQMGVGFVKIVGRTDTTIKKIKDVNFMSKIIAYLEACSSEEDFISKAKQLRIKMYGRKGCNPDNCAYQFS